VVDIVWAMTLINTLNSRGCLTFKEIEYLDEEWGINGVPLSRHKSALRYWLNELFKRGFIENIGKRRKSKILCLAGLGRWLSEYLEDYGEFGRRFEFALDNDIFYIYN